MTKSELNAYLGILKAIAKSNRLETLKGIAIDGGTAEATNLDLFAQVSLGVAGYGIYNSSALDLIKVAPEADLAGYQVGEMRDWPEVRVGEMSPQIDLAAHNLTEIICHAADFISTDTMRPALTGVWAKNGEIAATNGYIAYTSGEFSELNLAEFSLPSFLLKHFKKVAKFGEWKLEFNADFVRLCNGHFTLISKQLAGTFPDVRNLANTNRDFAYRIDLPYAQIKTLISKTDCRLRISKTGEIALENRPLPIRAEIAEVAYTYDEKSPRTLLCALADQGDQDLIAINGNLLKVFKTDKGGKIRIESRPGSSVYAVHEPTD